MPALLALPGAAVRLDELYDAVMREVTQEPPQVRAVESPELSAWSTRDRAIRSALALADAGRAYFLAPVQRLQLASDELKDLVPLINYPPEIWVRCQACGWRFTKWVLTSTGHVMPVVRVTKSTTPGWEALPWLDRANNKKGPIDIGKAAGGDGKGTQNYRCPKCRRPGKVRNVPLSASSRLKQYLHALLANERETFI